MLGICLTLIEEESDKEKFEHLYNTYNGMMLKLAMSVLHNRALADETVQDCLLKLAEMISEIQNVSGKSTRALIVVMVKNKARNNLKAEHYDKVFALDGEEFSEISDNTFNEILSDIGYKNLVDMVDSLDGIYRDVLVLRFADELSPAEIAETLEIPCKTVETRISRGRKILKEKLEEMYSERNV